MTSSIYEWSSVIPTPLGSAPAGALRSHPRPAVPGPPAEEHVHLRPPACPAPPAASKEARPTLHSSVMSAKAKSRENEGGGRSPSPGARDAGSATVLVSTRASSRSLFHRLPSSLHCRSELRHEPEPARPSVRPAGVVMPNQEPCVFEEGKLGVKDELFPLTGIGF